MVIQDTKIINHDLVIENADIYIKDGEIISIIPKEGPASRITIPGFIDTHVHGNGGYDVMDSQEAVKKVAVSLAKHGITSFFPTIMTLEHGKMLEALSNIASVDIQSGAKIQGIHSEGPFISLIKKGAHDPNYIINADYSFLQNMQAASKNLLKKITYAPEVGTSEFISQMHKLGIVVSLGHTNSNYSTALEALQCGTKSVTHFWNAMTGIVNRDPGFVQAAITYKNTFVELIIDMIHVDFATLKFTLDIVGPERIVAVSDGIRPAGLPDGESTSGGLKIVKKGALITLKDSDTIAGSGATLYDAFLILTKQLGVSIQNAVKITSYNATQNFKMEKIGKIKEGYWADLIVMDLNLGIKQVLINGVAQ